ncbi:MAG: hypothetical protein KF856_19105 [Cyclobacteriaceae bacterium]|nr:hypothetical protein [Cyclobacteriaceae bacterium]
MNSQQDPLNHIRQLLESKSTAKQITYKNLLAAFSILSKESARIIDELKTAPADTDVTVDFSWINEHEFHVKLAGDLLVFVLHTNVVTFDEEHGVMKTIYIREKDVNRYFGQIMIYNFMSDSLKFNRMNDPGYLIARLLINHEGRFLVEGDGQLGFLFNSISAQPIRESDLNTLVKLSLTAAIENDLMAPPFPQVRFITLFQKQEKTQELGAGQKIGFKMSYQGNKPG